MYKILLGSPSQRFLKKCETAVYTRIIDRLDKLAIDPFPADVKRVVSRHDKIFRVRVGDYRIQYAVFYDKNEILITDIDKRPRAYN